MINVCCTILLLNECLDCGCFSFERRGVMIIYFSSIDGGSAAEEARVQARNPGGVQYSRAHESRPRDDSATARWDEGS
ncbi:hypothetical protein L210DRAFT_3579513 [Boletus edulis BED1]|uniref:Uncharacterized protein n=1 Tax=Boletus edulis BED1 TaxID=1328754 RepID=A0AAD4BCS1_BOLED|nr:hypothetical protein L210DRAFT_3579513 [Boletus edulis BED1]